MEPELPPNQSAPDAGDPAADTPGDPPPPPGPTPDPPTGGGGGGGGWALPFQILRSKQDKKLGGVAGGLAAVTGLDPTLVRLAIVLGWLTGWGVLAYVIAWAVIPAEDPAKGRYLVPAPEPTAKYIRIGLTVVAALGVLQIIGAILGIVSAAVFGIGLLPFHILGLGDDHGFEVGEALLGLILLIGGCLLLFRRHLPWMPATDGGPGSGGAWSSGWTGGPGSGPGGSGSPGWTSGTGSGPGGGTGGSGSPGWTGGTGSGPGGGSAGTGSPGDTGAGASAGGGWSGPTPASPGTALATITPGSSGGGATAGGYGGGGGYGPPPPPPGSGGGAAGAGGFGARASAAARAARTNGPLLLVRATGWLVGLWFLAAAMLGGAFWLTGALRVRYPVLPIVAVLAALGVLGYTLLRSRRVAAVVAAMALLLVPTALAAAVTRVDGQAGDRSITPRVASDLDREYRHAIGVLSLDLSALQLPPGPTPLEISMGAGQVEVTVPWDAEVEARASVSAGSFDLFGNRQTGVNLDGKSRSSGQPGAPVLVITAKAGAGEIIVRRGYEPFTHQALRTGQPVPVSCYPDGPPAIAAAASSTMHCSAADGVTKIPALACVVSESGSALCRPAGEPEPVVDFADDPGTRRCQVPAGGGRSLCTAPNPGTRSDIGGQGSFTCTIPAGGGPAVCHPAGSGSGPPPPAPPADPNAPGSTTPATPVPPAPPGEYRCTVPDGGGPASCEPI